MTDIYRRIINKNRVYSSKHPQMSNSQRAAQFAPFAALAGYEDAIHETARITDDIIELSEDKVFEIDLKLQKICNNLDDFDEVKVIYFMDDDIKQGGKYITHVGKITTIDKITKTINFSDNTSISISQIYDIDIEIG